MKRFEPFDTTADVGLKVYGKDFLELLENSARGMFSIIIESVGISSLIEKEIDIEGETGEDLLVSLLNELIFLFETEDFLLSDISGREISPGKLGYLLKGESYSPSRHILSTHIKAVTYHNLEIKKKDYYYTEIVFDV